MASRVKGASKVKVAPEITRTSRVEMTPRIKGASRVKLALRVTRTPGVEMIPRVKEAFGVKRTSGVEMASRVGNGSRIERLAGGGHIPGDRVPEDTAESREKEIPRIRWHCPFEVNVSKSGEPQLPWRLHR